MSEIVRRRVRVAGLVQGVFFRASTRDKARELGVVGWVRNTRDGAVELEVEGPRGAVEDLVDWCGQGPRTARVDAVASEELSPLASESSFDVRY